jgi:hypothetical protein
MGFGLLGTYGLFSFLPFQRKLQTSATVGRLQHQRHIMKISKLIVLAALALTAGVAFADKPVKTPVELPDEPTLSACSFSDLTGVTVTKCAGFAAGNLINNSTADVATVKSILLNTFAVSSTDGAWIEKLDGLGGTHTINFTKPLSGRTIVALHFGNGKDGPGNGTAFYEFNAGSNLDTFTTTFNASSNAAIYMTAAVPEPETYALLLAGLGLMGTIVRRRKQKTQAA